ncbi:MAG: hypothetical protein ACQER7_14555, partial [Bacteroidota bacterium]
MGGIAKTYASNNIDEKVEALVEEMTLDEKIGQMVQVDPGVYGSEEKLKEAIREGQIGSLLNMVGAEDINELQR